LAMGAAIWSCPQDQFAEFPIRFIAKFFENHGLLSITNRPQWYVISGGSREYVKKFTAPFSDRIHLNSPVERVRRVVEGIEVVICGDDVRTFDHVIFACHSDQALRMLEEPSVVESEVLSCFPYEKNSAVLHIDESLLPKKRSAWAAWNYHIRNDQPRASTVTYNMNILQNINSRRTFCVTLNEDDLIDPDKVLGQYNYAHPLFTLERESAQNRHRELINHDGISYCGAYWGNGFHEDGVNSALAVTQVLNSSEHESGATCTAASMKAGSAIVE
ncbi:FAD-dependent oxidoreductase, partial [Planctomycetaceae bacterium]|nr:FAD-dependent oxidoreductase [Planctomycetaceae bacterium]